MNRFKSALRAHLSTWLVFLPAFLSLLGGCSVGTAGQVPEADFDAAPVVWFEENNRQEAWLILDELAVFPAADRNQALEAARQILPEATVRNENGAFILLGLPASVSKTELFNKITEVSTPGSIRRAGVVLYRTPVRDPSNRLVPTGEVIVRYQSGLTQNRIEDIERRHRVHRVKAINFLENTVLYTTFEPLASVEAANGLRGLEQVIFAYPDMHRVMVERKGP